MCPAPHAVAPELPRYPSLEPLDTDEGWAKWNVHDWRRDYRGFLEFFFAEQFPEEHALCRRVRCPVLVVHGELDGCQPRERAVAVAELTGGTLVALEGAGHLPQARHPVKVNGLLREFAAMVVPPKRG